eukprot:TRINITY_DN15329_c0_g8_i1.p1 TRINITY_DN15329_c0_g8~~TRINITY_DN15329_c0_g8_i1.p1  ORF type:complete len:117 (-),score=10.18 TRINITY_DN15329_c0_g8_i1:73-423(-)
MSRAWELVKCMSAKVHVLSYSADFVLLLSSCCCCCCCWQLVVVVDVAVAAVVVDTLVLLDAATFVKHHASSTGSFVLALFIGIVLRFASTHLMSVELLSLFGSVVALTSRFFNCHG